MRKNLAEERIGEVRKNNYGSLMEIVEYNNANDIQVKFVDYDYAVHAGYKDFKKGNVRNPYDKTVYGIGFLGVGMYEPFKNDLHSKYRSFWNSMIERCYSERFQRKCPTYIGCSVCEEWHNFQNFAKWCDENYYNIEGEIIHLDKDILFKGNRVYSPETCTFAPNSINIHFRKKNVNKEGNLPIGVLYSKGTKNFRVDCKDGNGKTKYMGSFKTIEEAFEVYKAHKEKLIRKVAEDYKGKIPVKLYDAMVCCKVDITD